VIYFVVIGPKNVAISRAGTQCFPGPESGIMEFGIFDDLAQKAGIRFGDVASPEPMELVLAIASHLAHMRLTFWRVFYTR
jgi:hypothetical protein